MIKFIYHIFLILICVLLARGIITAPIITLFYIKEIFTNMCTLAFTIPVTILIVIFSYDKEIRFAMRYGKFRIGKNGVEMSSYSEGYFDDTVKNIWDKNNERYKNCD